MPKTKEEKIERLTLKLPKSLAEYFRQTFPHGKRSDFVAHCILRHKQDQEVKAMEDELRKVSKHRQS